MIVMTIRNRKEVKVTPVKPKEYPGLIDRLFRCVKEDLQGDLELAIRTDKGWELGRVARGEDGDIGLTVISKNHATFQKKMNILCQL